MSDPIDETPEEFVAPGPEIAGNQVAIHVGSRTYIFERQPHGGLMLVDHYTNVFVDEDEPEPFDPSQYR